MKTEEFSLDVMNVLRIKLDVPDFPHLNLTVSCFGQGGIEISLHRAPVDYFSDFKLPNYFSANIRISMLRASSSGRAWYKHMVSGEIIPSLTIYPDTPDHLPYVFQGAEIIRYEDIKLNGKCPLATFFLSATFPVGAREN